MRDRAERLMVRNGTFYARICVPKSLVSRIGKKAIVSSLRTKDPKVAKRELPRQVVAIEEWFDELRAIEDVRAARETAAQKAERARAGFSSFAQSYARDIAAHELFQRAELFAAATKNPTQLWAGELPRFEILRKFDADSDPEFGRLKAEGDLEQAVAYLNRALLLQHIDDLRRWRAAGNIEEFVLVAQQHLKDVSPPLDHIDVMTLARLLVSELMRELEEIAKREWDQHLEGVGRATLPDSRAPALATIGRTAQANRGVSLDGLFARWEVEAEPSASTLSSWRGIVRDLKSFLGAKASDIGQITHEDMVGWKDRLVKAGKAPATITRGYLGCARTLFRYAAANGLVHSDPSQGIKVARKKKAGTKMLGYTNDEVARLLEIACQAHEPWKKWLPWLAAATGSRIGEVAQLHGSHVYEVEGIPVIKIMPAPDAGSIKNDESEREVPVHSALIQAGFLEFVKDRGQGPLFYRRSSGDPKRKHASKGVTNRLAAWIRQNGFDDPRKAPNHALRHWFKTQAARVGIPDSVTDKIQGHADGSASDLYRHIDVHMMTDAMAKIELPPRRPGI